MSDPTSDPTSETPADYPRDLAGYRGRPPHPRWPGGALAAVQFVVNVEEGGERNVLHGDPESEAFLSEIVGAEPWRGERHPNMESIYEYGSRAGFWRLHRLFLDAGVRPTAFAVATALERTPHLVPAMREGGWEIASHGLRWIEHRHLSRDEEAAQMREAVRIHERLTGEPPRGWYQGRSSVNTLDLVDEIGREVWGDPGFAWAADSYADDLPYWREAPGGPQLIVPYTLDANDMRFATPQGFNSGAQFEQYLNDALDVLLAEGAGGAPKMMSVGLHCRLAGRPGRAAALGRFLTRVADDERIWCATRGEIAAHWREEHPA